ncbi:MAG TPA: M48 family metallopeptidase, partial [Desulfobaccales bacterium]|nr:M48 family metallopeptidase [Desulfobaccales bacterium]
GILKYTKNEAGLATVISHEVAHALARHAGERMSQSTLAQLGGIGLGAALGGMSPTAGQAIMQGYSLGTQLGVLLPYSRTQEYEADHIGLILMAKAGYDPAQAVAFWKRMMLKDRKGVKLPQFLSTHPTDANRIRQIEAFLPEARKYYLAARKPATPPPPRQWQSRNLATPSASPAPAAGRWLPLR